MLHRLAKHPPRDQRDFGVTYRNGKSILAFGSKLISFANAVTEYTLDIKIRLAVGHVRKIREVAPGLLQHSLIFEKRFALESGRALEQAG